MKWIYYISFWLPVLIYGQTLPIKNDSISDEFLVIVGDTITNNSIALNEVYILPKLKIPNSKSRLRYLILQRKTIKVYPYAKLASERLETMNARMITLKSKRKRKKYTRLIQKFIEDEFSEKLKKFTKTEGQILIKLIHRQTGETAFDLIKTLRSGWRAFWYNNTALLFDISLKIPFDPLTSEEDYLIEDILQRQFQNGRLEYQKPFIEFDLYELSEEWKP
ncbi:DUF4294 domain-containing protein [Flavobacteriaceae bacterium]|nr:DUF4294 domain-containing protein [Flavobacteriaceae bacterium]MDC0118118.1 DUF4294 domain-containing protein [bacterium]MDG1394342.1 DUF4294 domain-containing protein [Flavobacteriaceae bacterium]